MSRFLLTLAIWAAALNVQAGELADQTFSVIDATVASPEVQITPIPMPSPVIELLKPINPVQKLNKAARKIKLAKQQPLPNLLLSRTERHLLGLIVTREATLKAPGHHFFDDEDGLPDFDDLVLHRSFSRPRLTSDDPNANDDEDQGLPISDHARLRLFMARLKALEAHALNQVEDDQAPLPERVQDRLAAARMAALAVHRQHHRT